jgi:hypothetical protein
MPEPGFIQQQYAFAAHIRAPDSMAAPPGIEDRRMAIYRELFYNNIESFLCNSFPVLRELTQDDAWHALVRDFYATHRCHSPLFLEIPHEFLGYLERERGEQPEDPPFLRELAHYEWVELALSVADTPPPGGVDAHGDLLARLPIPSPLAWPLSYRYPVHRISPDFQPHEPGEQPTYLLVYRGGDDEVSFLELNPVSARLFALLQEGAVGSGRETLERIAQELNHPEPGAVIDGGRAILEEWRKRDIVLGTRKAA